MTALRSFASRVISCWRSVTSFLKAVVVIR
jgi:hypothetical protein